MPGDDRIRHCPQCDLDVYNFSGMTTPEIAHLVKESRGRLCGRFFQRSDGTILTADCPVAAPPSLSSPPLLATAALAALMSIAPTRVAAAQSQSVALSATKSSGQVLSLVVRDPSGAVVPNSAILLVNTKTSERFEAKTNELGEFSSSTLPAGTYNLTVTSPGFFSFTERSITTPATITINLQLGVMGEVVEIPETLDVVENSSPLREPTALVQRPPFQSADQPSALRRFFAKLRHVFQ